MSVDGPLLAGLLLLITIGLFVLYSAGNQQHDVVLRQCTRFFAGFVVMLAIAQIPPYSYQRWAPWCYLIGIGLLIGVMFLGTGAKGAQRWLAIPGVARFQPSEIMKLGLPLVLAWYLADRALPPAIGPICASLILIMIPVSLIATQPDLGTALLVGSSGIIVLLLAGLSWRVVSIFIAASIPSAAIMWFFVMRDYQRQRVLTFLDPESDPLGAGWNIIQSKTAIGSGGIHGKGWLEGTQSHLDFLPEGSTDFVIAVLAEEFGFKGVCVLLLVYLAIIFRGTYIAMKAQDTFGRLLAGSITFTFFVYIFVNIGMVSGILPVVGVPLPLVSYGGTSIVTLLAGFGILMSIHTHRKLHTK